MRSIDFDTQASTLHVSGQIAAETKHAKVGQYHTLDLELGRNFTLEKVGAEGEGWDSVARGIVREACDEARVGEVWAVVMQEGVANVAVLTGSRTVVRQRVEVGVPRKRGVGRQGEHDKVRLLGDPGGEVGLLGNAEGHC